MLELVRGYAAAVLDEVEAAGALGEAVSALAAFRGLLIASEPLRTALTDGSIPSSDRSAVLSDLLEGKVPSQVVALVTFPVVYERAAEIPKTCEQLLEIAEFRAEGVAIGALVEPESPMGRAGALERLRGFAERVFERISDPRVVETMEDEFFRFARIAEQSPQLKSALASTELGFAARQAVLHDLLAGKVRPETLELLGYVLRCGRSRDLVGAVSYLVELAAAEQGRRVADIRAAVELDADERSRLADALGRRTRRTIELRLVIDPSVIGGLGVSVGDTIIDGTIRHRLDLLRETILQPS
ncbi:MAG: ATP synthase F1 subunit delta [Acidimicrobiales bacterium]